MALLFLIFYYSNYRQKRRLGESLNRQKALLKAQRDQLAEQNIQLKRLSQQVEEATKAKIAFFTNVSHDFRTPLTLISAPLEQIQQKLDRGELDGAGGKDPEATQLLNLALKNVKVLQRLVGQLLDFRKLESGKLDLDLKPVDLRQACQTSFGYFKGLAYKKHIKLDFSADEGDYRTMADLPKLERVFFNLMGNAFKFTPENGRIAVSLSTSNPSNPSNPSNSSNLSNSSSEQVLPLSRNSAPAVRGIEGVRRNEGVSSIILRVADTGPGINVEHIQRIFENFYQVDSARHEGSGIGLAVAKSFVELHGGTIEVQNQTEGTGTIFTVTIPRVAVTEDETVDAGSLQIDAATIETELGDSFEGENAIESEPKPLVLVIDDNADLRQYMQMLLGEHYRVITAGDGLTGVGKAMRTVPDVIVCDMMMPVMDGIECCRRLKQEVNTSHIPILMLTANAMDEQRVKGLAEGGADAYMSKPFNADVLRAQLRSLVDNHNRVRDFFGSQPGAVPKTDAPDTPSIDDKFLVKMKDIIERRLSDSDFGVEQLGDMMGMSRAQLYRKTKALTNYSPVELIRNMRLKRAQQMLAQGDDTIAQVAYSVGFTAPSYFTKCYKDFFGEMPNELVKRKTGNN
jgi:signal transduction histidine kinase/AraC-like DNA-binding protein